MEVVMGRVVEMERKLPYQAQWLQRRKQHSPQSKNRCSRGGMKKSTITMILHVSWLECNHPESLPPKLLYTDTLY